MQAVKVVHVSTSDTGGAGRAAYRLHQGLCRLGIDSSMFVAHKKSSDPSVREYSRTKGLSTQFIRRWRRWQISRVFRPYRRNARNSVWNFNSDETAFGADPWSQLPAADLIHLHWVVQFVDYSSFFASLPEGKQFVWTLHDMAPLAGGCHWTYGCERFTEQCGACPQLGSSSESDVTRGIWLRRRASLERLHSRQLHIVAPSRWLASEAKRSSLFSRFPCSVIPYGLDTDVFAPQGQRSSRIALGVAPDTRVILFAADGINDRRKGLHLLFEALRGLRAERETILLSLGPGRPPRGDGFSYRHLPRVNDDLLLASIYSAGDIYVAPSEQDNLPNTVLESIACGVPVAAFGVGGIPDVVRPGLTGYLARPGDVADLRAAICRMLERDDERAAMSKTCRKVAVQEYALEVQARRYLDLYQGLLQ
jgi:glycosyltransferase involved in cell wall biosynthesis